MENLNIHYVKTIEEALRVSLPEVAEGPAAKIISVMERLHYKYAWALARAGKATTSADQLLEYLEGPDPSSPNLMIAAHAFARTAGGLTEADVNDSYARRSIALLRLALREKKAQITSLQTDPELAPLHGRPDFARLVGDP